MVITTLSTNDHSQWEWITRSQQKTQGGRMTKKTRPLHMRVCVRHTHRRKAEGWEDIVHRNANTSSWARRTNTRQNGLPSKGCNGRATRLRVFTRRDPDTTSKGQARLHARCGIIYNSRGRETTCVSTNRRRAQEEVVSTHDGA